MIQPGKRTKVIWSLEGSRLNEFDMRKLVENNVAALRLIYSVEYEKELLFFLQALKIFRSDHGLYLPVMLDLADFSFNFSILSDLEVDYLVLPGAYLDQILHTKEVLSSFKNSPWVIGKIDSYAIYEKLDDLLDSVDGVMICRRELSLTTHPATVPMLGKQITQKSFEKAKLVIMASEVLASMRHNPTPTRAEVSDIANAVIDGCDGVVLSEEVELGPYQERAYEVCHSIISDIENETQISINWQRGAFEIANELDAVSYYAYQTAERLKAKAIVCITKTGNTAMRLSSFRLAIPIIAITFTERIRRRLSLIRGVTPLVLDTDPNLDEILPAIHDRLRRESWLNKGDPIVFVTVTISSMGSEASNLFSIQRVE
jgi:pyruvate kinase